MPRISGRCGKIMAGSNYCAGIIYDWHAELGSDRFKLWCDKYYLDKYAPGRGKPVRVELHTQDIKWIGLAEINSDVIFDCLANHGLTLLGLEKLERKKR